MIADAPQTGTIKVPALAAPASVSDMREGMVADEMLIAQRSGVTLDRRTAERLIASDLALTDAVEREAPAQWSPSPADAEEAEHVAAERGGRLASELAKRGASVPDADAGWSVRNSRVLHATSVPDSQWSRAKMRIARICAGLTPHANIMIATSTCEAPALAREIVALQAFVAASVPGRHTGKWTPQRPGDEPNPFHGLKPDDFGRKFMRMIENICDRSTGIPGLGPWRVPK